MFRLPFNSFCVDCRASRWQPLPMELGSSDLPAAPRLTWGPNAIVERPLLAIQIATAVAIWGEIEDRLDAFCLLCTQDEGALQQFRETRGWDKRCKFIEAAVKDRLGPGKAIEVRAVLDVVKQPAGKRHDIAHCTWGLCEEAPHDLVIIKDVMTSALAIAVQQKLGAPIEPLLSRDIAIGRARLVTLTDLVTLVEELAQARMLLHNLMVMYLPENIHVHARDKVALPQDHPEVRRKIEEAKRGLAVAERQRRRLTRRARNRGAPLVEDDAPQA